MPRGREGNRRSGIALAMHHELKWEMSTPPTPQLGHGSLYLLPSHLAPSFEVTLFEFMGKLYGS